MTDAIWKKEISVDILNSRNEDTLMGSLGIEVTEVGPDWIRARMPVDGRTKQPFGLLHGGATAALVETLGSMGASWAMPPDQFGAGLEINTNHIRAMRSGWVHGTARPLQTGSRIHVWQVDVEDESGRQTATGRITLLAVPIRK